MSEAKATSERHVVDGVELPDGRPETWVYIRDLPTRAWMTEDMARHDRETGRSRESIRANRLERLKSMHYFRGKDFVYRQTERGKLVLRTWAHGDPAQLEYLESLTREERSGMHVGGWDDLDDSTSIIG